MRKLIYLTHSGDDERLIGTTGYDTCSSIVRHHCVDHCVLMLLLTNIEAHVVVLSVRISGEPPAVVPS